MIVFSFQFSKHVRPQTTSVMPHFTLRCLFKFALVLEREALKREIDDRALSLWAGAVMQRMGLIDNASGEEIHQGPHPFNA